MKYTIILLFWCYCVISYGQNQDIVKSFDSLVENSNNWTTYRVIKKENLKTFKEELIVIKDSLTTQIKNLENSINNYQKQLNNLDKTNKDLVAELTTFKNAKDEINLLGLKMSKANYQILVWSIIVLLLLILIFLFIKYRNRNIVTQELKENLANTTREFEEYKHRAIEKQQKLGRELLDAQKAVQARNNKK